MPFDLRVHVVAPARFELATTVCKQGRRVRYATTAQLIDALVEAADERILSCVVARYGRLDLLLLHELGYVQIDPRGAELLSTDLRDQRRWSHPLLD